MLSRFITRMHKQAVSVHGRIFREWCDINQSCVYLPEQSAILTGPRQAWEGGGYRACMQHSNPLWPGEYVNIVMNRDQIEKKKIQSIVHVPVDAYLWKRCRRSDYLSLLFLFCFWVCFLCLDYIRDKVCVVGQLSDRLLCCFHLFWWLLVVIVGVLLLKSSAC